MLERIVSYRQFALVLPLVAMLVACGGGGSSSGVSGLVEPVADLDTDDVIAGLEQYTEEWSNLSPQDRRDLCIEHLGAENCQ